MQQHNITRAKIEHLLKVGLWQQWKKCVPIAADARINATYDPTSDNTISPAIGPEQFSDRELLAWKYIYMCGSNIMSVANTLDELDIKNHDVALFPKIIYYPPALPRANWFDVNGINRLDFEPTEEDPRSLDTSHAVCVMPFTDSMPVETYDFSPFELCYVHAEQLYGRFVIFCMINNRALVTGLSWIPRDVMKIIWRHFRYTSNSGYTIRQ